MRKVLSLLLCVALLCSMVVISVQADDLPTASFDNAVGVPGGSVTVGMRVVNNPGLAAVRFTITNDLGVVLGTDMNPTDNEDDGLGMTVGTSIFWSGAANFTDPLGTLTIDIPEDAEPGVYTFTVVADQGARVSEATGKPVKVELEDTTFTVTVTDKVITGVNVAIDAGLAIGIHVSTTDADNTSITAVDVAGEKFTTVEDYKEDEENGGYIYYLKVNPWDMDKEFTVDLTDNFSIDEGTDELNLNAIPETARTISILSYCNAVKGTSDELDQLIADLLAFGQQAQIFNGAEKVSYDLPEGLAATEAAWENGDGDPCSFGDFCSENYPEDQTGKNANAKKKFVFDYATIEFGSQFVATFTFANGATSTASNLARVKVNGETYSLDGWNFTYSFNPAEYAGVEFDLYAAAQISATNFAWINNYGPAHYAAYLNDNYGEEAADILAVLEAFYLYGASVEAYVATLG